MSVYVDRASNPLGRMKMCHMLADTLDELHAMADKIGMKREWFQANADHPHYDLSKTKRALAVSSGAIEIDNRQLIELLRKWRATNETPFTFLAHAHDRNAKNKNMEGR